MFNQKWCDHSCCSCKTTWHVCF